MNIKKLKQFIIKAKINTYASNEEGEEKILSDGSKKLIFKDGDFRYTDNYFGSESFIGKEVVFYKNNAVWTMNYSGEIISEIILKKEIYNFLKESLKKIPLSKPFRGPSSFKKGDFKYINQSKGNLQNFTGKEYILYKNKKVYKLSYQGELIK